MLKSLEDIFATYTIATGAGDEKIPLHSNTSKEQGLFLQKIFDIIKPQRSVEVGFAYGISTLFILEKHREFNSDACSHIVIEPKTDTYWGTAAEYNIGKEGLSKYLDIRRDRSDKILTKLYHENANVQYAYVDTTKQFDVVFQDFYFIDKILDVGGVFILDDCGGGWPGVQRVARYINTLPHYKILGVHGRSQGAWKKVSAESLLSSVISMMPFKKKFYPTLQLKTDKQLGLNFGCIAFQKISNDERNWDFDRSF